MLYLYVYNILKTRFNSLSGLGISGILINIISCIGFSKLTTSTEILTCCSALVPYYLPKLFINVDKLDGVSLNIPDPVLRKINASQLHDEDIILACKAENSSIVKTLNIIEITRDVYNKFKYSWYDDIYVEPIIEKFHCFCQTMS